MKVMTPIFLKRPVQVIRSPGTKLCIIGKPYGKFATVPAPSRNSYFNRTSHCNSLSTAASTEVPLHTGDQSCVVVYNIQQFSEEYFLQEILDDEVGFRIGYSNSVIKCGKHKGGP
jgi:hypothetical protein